MKKLMLLLLCVAISVTAGCGRDTESVMSYKGYNSTEALYSYWMSTYKSNFLYFYNEGIDSDEFWNTLISDEQSYEEYVSEWFYTEMQHRTIALYLFDEYKLKLSNDKVKAIDDDIAEKLDYAGSREQLNKELAKMNMNIDMLRDVYIANAKYDAVYEYLYGSKGKNAPTSKEKAEYFSANYSCIKCITIYSGAILATDESGNYLYDDEGNIELISLNEEEKETKQKIIDTVLAGAKAGGDFDEYIKEFSEVDYNDYSNGFFVSANDYSKFGADIINSAKELKVGEVTSVSDDVVTYIIKKLPLPEYSSLSSQDLEQLDAMNDALVREKFTAEFDEYAKDVDVNKTIIDKYSIKDISENSYF